jgi:hypothetical protein
MKEFCIITLTLLFFVVLLLLLLLLPWTAGSLDLNFLEWMGWE